MRIFTVNRESGSSLKSKTKPVCTRSSRSRIAQAVLFCSLAVLTGPALKAQNNAATAPTAEQGVQTLCQPEVIGNRRIPKESVLARLFSHQNDLYDPSVVERDFNSLWNTGYFEDIKFLREQTPKGWRLIVQVKEKPTIREINYVGLSSVSNSDVLDRFKQDKVGLVVESQYDPTRIKKAEVSIKNLLSEHGDRKSVV